MEVDTLCNIVEKVSVQVETMFGRAYIELLIMHPAIFIQGARDLAKPPTLTDILHCTMEKAKSGENQSKEGKHEGDEEKEESEEGNKGLKRKLDECSEDSQQDDDTKKENGQVLKQIGKFKKAKNVGTRLSHFSCFTFLQE